MTTTDSYCDIASKLYFDSEQTVDYLIQNDQRLLVDILVHNETAERVCKD